MGGQGDGEQLVVARAGGHRHRRLEVGDERERREDEQHVEADLAARRVGDLEELRRGLQARLRAELERVRRDREVGLEREGDVVGDRRSRRASDRGRRPRRGARPAAGTRGGSRRPRAGRTGRRRSARTAPMSPGEVERPHQRRVVEGGRDPDRPLAQVDHAERVHVQLEQRLVLGRAGPRSTVPSTTTSRSGNEITIPSSAVTSAFGAPGDLGREAEHEAALGDREPRVELGHDHGRVAERVLGEHDRVGGAALQPGGERLDVHRPVQGQQPADAGEQEAEAERQPGPRRGDAREQRPLRVAGQPGVDHEDRAQPVRREARARRCRSSGPCPARSR